MSIIQPQSMKTMSTGRQNAVLLAVYLAFSIPSLTFAELQPNTSLVWPVSGVAVAAAVIFGWKILPAIFVGALVTNFYALMQAGLPFSPAMVATVAGVALANTGEAGVAGWLVHRYAGGSDPFSRSHFACRFVLLGAVLPAMISALGGVTSLILGGFASGSDLGDLSVKWFTANLAGTLIVGGALLLPWTARQAHDPSFRRHWPERALLLVLFFVVGNTMTGLYTVAGLDDWPKAYMILPLLMWAIFRFGRRGAALGLVLISIHAILGTHFGYAVFPTDDPERSLLYLQTFLSVVAGVSWVIGAAVHELRLARSKLEDLATAHAVQIRTLTRERDELVAATAHDLRSPLAGIRNLFRQFEHKAEQLTPERLRALAREGCSGASEALARTLRLLEQMDSRNLKPGTQAVDWVELVRQNARRAKLWGESAGVTVHWECDHESAPGVTDPLKVNQVVENLLSNAIKHSPPGATVSLQLKVKKDRVTIQVIDSGPGFSREALAEAFVSYPLSHRSIPTDAESSSWGFGLFIVRKLVHELGGTVTCESKSGVGSAFVVLLPRTSGSS
jgi:signal transduction histidine kinase